MKKLLLFILCLLCFGCGNTSNKKEEVFNYVLNESNNNIIEKLDKSITNVMFFPEQNVENEFIYLVEAIKENIHKFSDEERKNIYDKLQIEYDFAFNNLHYTKSQFENDVDDILEK